MGLLQINDKLKGTNQNRNEVTWWNTCQDLDLITLSYRSVGTRQKLERNFSND